MTDSTITPEDVEQWTAELASLEEKLTNITEELVEVAAPAEAGNKKATTRRDELRTEQAATVTRIDELRSAIESAQAHLKREADAQRERERQDAESRANELLEKQRVAGSKVDAALAELETAYAEFNALHIDRLVAFRSAHGKAPRALVDDMLARAIYKSAPTIALALRLPRTQKRFATPMEEAV